MATFNIWVLQASLKWAEDYETHANKVAVNRYIQLLRQSFRNFKKAQNKQKVSSKMNVASNSRQGIEGASALRDFEDQGLLALPWLTAQDQ